MAKTRILLTEREYQHLISQSEYRKIADSAQAEIRQLQDALELVQRNRAEEIAERDKRIEELENPVGDLPYKELYEVERKRRVELESCLLKAQKAAIEPDPDAELGRLVRAIPTDGSLYHGLNSWVCGTTDDEKKGNTPEEALRAAGVSVSTWECRTCGAEVPATLERCGICSYSKNKDNLLNQREFEESVHQQAKAGMVPIEEDPRNGSDDGFPAEYAKQHGREMATGGNS